MSGPSAWQTICRPGLPTMSPINKNRIRHQ
jgi:hypothetical protein